jgi:hypothetical protein
MSKAPKQPTPKTQAPPVNIGKIESSVPQFAGLPRPTMGSQPSQAESMIGGQMPRSRYDQDMVMKMLQNKQMG